MISSAINHIKFHRLKRRLKLATWQAVGVLESLWLFTQLNSPDGAIGAHSDEDIAAWMGWEGEPESLVAAMVESGWLDRSERYRLIVHDWADHAPRYVRGNMIRHGKPFASNSTEETPQESPQEPTEEAALGSTQQSPPNLTKPNQTKPREEEPRKTDCTGPSKPTDAVPSEFSFPIKSKGGLSRWTLSMDSYQSLKTTFVGLDVDGELLKAAEWCRINVNDRKTPRGMERFLFGWLERSNNSGRRSNGHQAPPPKKSRIPEPGSPELLGWRP